MRFLKNKVFLLEVKVFFGKLIFIKSRVFFHSVFFFSRERFSLKSGFLSIVFCNVEFICFRMFFFFVTLFYHFSFFVLT